MENSPEDRDEVEKMAVALRQINGVVFDRSCGLHVHVGYGHDGLGLAPLQRMATLLYAGGEDILSLVHDKTRQENQYCEKIGSNSIVARSADQPDKGKATVPAAVAQHLLSETGPLQFDSRLRNILRKIWKAGDLDAFCELVDSGLFRGAYCFSQLLGFDIEAATKTIEFRQAAGSMKEEQDAHFPRIWVHATTNLVAWAIDADDDKLVEVVKRVYSLSRTEQMNAADKVCGLLSSINVASDTVESFRKWIHYMANRSP